MEGSGGARPPVIGLILAGGSNSRMGGRFKGDLELGGERYVVRVARALRSLPVERLLVSLREGQEMTLDDMGGHIPLSLVRDPREGLGPLGGLLAALGC
ncbi:MAG: NTP transferase domain-containing protein, partial [Olsenella profusa]